MSLQSHCLTLTGLSPSTAPLSNGLQLQLWFFTLRTSGSNVLNDPTTPHTQRPPAITRMRFSLIRFRSPLLSESLLFSLPVGTEMFHFPTFPPHTLYIQARVTGHDSSWVSPFGHPRITAWLPTPQGLSQAPTSFIGSRCQGIHHVPFVACLTNTTQQQLLQRCSRPLCRSQTTNPPTTHPALSSTSDERRPNLNKQGHQEQAKTPHPTPHNHPAQDQPSDSIRYGGRLIPQGPTVCQPITHHHTPPGSTPTPDKEEQSSTEEK